MLVYLAVLETEQEKTKFEQLYLTYRQTMFHVANSVLHDTQLAEDAVHQAFLRIMDHMGNISKIECPQTSLRTGQWSVPPRRAMKLNRVRDMTA